MPPRSSTKRKASSTTGDVDKIILGPVDAVQAAQWPLNDTARGLVDTDITARLKQPG